MNVFDLVAKLTIDTSEYDKGLDDSESKASSFGDKLKSGLSNAGKIGAAAIGAVTTAGVAAAGAFASGTKKVAEYGDNIDKMSQKMGLSAEAYQEWDFIMQHSGASIDSMTVAMKTMSNAAENGNESFQKLGITQEQMASMSQEELFGAVISGLQNMEAGTERTYLASQLLGRGATELGALLNTSAEDTEAMRQKVHELGGVLSDEAVKSAAAFQDSMQDLQVSVQGLGRGMLSDFMPSITQVMDGLTSIFSGDKGGIKMVSEGISDMIKKMGDSIPTIIDTGMEIMDSLLDVIIDNLPKIIESGVEIIIKLATGLIQALPKLLAKAPEIIAALVKAIIQNAPQLLSAALELVLMLGKGIVNNFPKVMEWGRQLVDTVKNAIMSKVYEAADWGRDLIQNFINGILEKWYALRDTISGVAQTVRDFLGFSEPKKGPLSNFHTYAPDMMQMFAKGIKDNENLITNQLNSSLSFPDKSFEFSGSGASYGSSMNSYTGSPINITVYGAEGQDVNQLADILIDEITRRTEREKVAFA